MTQALTQAKPATSTADSEKQIQVAMISHGYYPLIGGAERQLAAVAPALQSIGVKVNILTRRHPGLFAI